MSGKHSKSGSNQGHPKPDDAGAGEQKRKVSGDVRVRGEILVDLHPNIVRKQGSDDENKNSREEKKLRLEWATFWAAVIYAGLTAGLLIYSHQAAISAQKSADFAQKEFEFSERPWISITKLEATQLVYDHNLATGYTVLNYELKNVGHSVANNVMFFPHIVSQTEETFTDCSAPPNGWQSEMKLKQGGILIFPEQAADGVGYPAPLRIKKVEPNASLRLIACVFYTSPADTAVHHTKIEFWIDRTDQQNQTFDLTTNGTFAIRVRPDINGTEAN
jgi:hypothetical protein